MIWVWTALCWADDAPLTVDEAVARALQRANDYAIAADDEAIAAAEARNAHSSLLPSLGAEAEARWTSVAPGQPGVPAYTSADGVTWYRGTVGLSGSLLGGLGSQAKAAKALLAAAHAGTEVARRELTGATVDAYYGLALARAQVAAAQANLAAEEELERVTELQFQGQEVAEVDVIRERVLAIARRDQLEQAQVDAANHAAVLAILIGPDRDWQVEALEASAPDLAGVEALLAETALVTPDVARAEAELDAANAEIRAARAASLPQIGYDAGYGFDTDTLGPTFGDHLGFTAGATLNVPIFDWGVGARAVEQARLAAHQAAVRREIAVAAHTSELTLAATEARAAARRADLLAKSLPDAKRNVEISTARYVAGETDLLEVTEAEQTLADTRSAVNAALFDYQTALFRLRQLVGR